MILLEKIRNFISEAIIEEIKEVLDRPRISKRLDNYNKEFIMDNLIRFSENIKPLIKLNIIKEDPDDNKFLECAMHAKADYIISGDEHLLNLQEFRSIKILSPADFIILIKDH